MSLPIADLPDVVNEQLAETVEGLRFWVARKGKRPTPAQARDSLDKVKRLALELLHEINKLDHTPRAHIVANLPADGLRDIGNAVARLYAAATAGSNAIPRRKGNVQVGVPRFAAEKVVAIFKNNGLRVTVSNNTKKTAAMCALSSVLQAAGYKPQLSQSALCKYLREAVKPKKVQSMLEKTAE